MHAVEHGYESYLFTMPIESSPKNDIIVGWPVRPPMSGAGNNLNSPGLEMKTRGDGVYSEVDNQKGLDAVVAVNNDCGIVCGVMGKFDSFRNYAAEK